MKQSKIVSIRELPPEETYDVTVDGNHNFISGYTGKPILTHNCLTRLIVGDVIYAVKAAALPAKVYGRETFITHRNPPKTWNGAMNFLIKSDERNRQIARQAIRDVRRGHVVLIPVTQHVHADILKRMIDYEYGKQITFCFTGKIPKNKRQEARDRMNNDQSIKVVIAMRSMLTGVNVPRWSAIYTIMPISNEPNYEQEVCRVCTPMEGKRQPIIRFFFDKVLGLSYGCHRTCLKTLTSKHLNFKLHPSIFRIADKPGGNRGTDPDGLDIARSPHGQRQPQGMRF